MTEPDHLRATRTSYDAGDRQHLGSVVMSIVRTRTTRTMAH
jgi:hypothetical protein